MNLENNRVLVAGADGFIGSHPAEHLLRAGVRVTAFAQYNSFNFWGWLEDLAARAKSVKLGNLMTTRDFTFVDDMCRGLLAVASLDNVFWGDRTEDTEVGEGHGWSRESGCIRCHCAFLPAKRRDPCKGVGAIRSF
jgi:nucleoside-diphosphate-sugar epimerase